MRQIKASEVKPGMVVKWASRGFTHEGPVMRLTSSAGGLVTRFINHIDGPSGMNVSSETMVTVLSEPAPPQPEEPTALGARVVVGERRFILVDNDSTPWLNMNTWVWYSWGELCNMGTVTVIDAAPSWTAPADKETSEVPSHIQTRDDWPEDDTPLRPYKWEAHGTTGGAGDTWEYVDGAWKWYNDSDSTRSSVCWPAPVSGDFPLTRIN